jgi:hypothetical protein
MEWIDDAPAGAPVQIRKWYADCVAADGSVFIGYSARLGLGPLAVPYQATLTGPQGRPLSQRTVVTSRGTPAMDGDGASWQCPALELAGRWTRSTPPFSRVLLDTPSVTIEWTCHMPAAKAAVRVGSRSLEGLGYLEEIRVHGDPTAIPIRELRWGRFLGEGDSVVWIDWIGPQPLTLVLHNGIEADDPCVTDGEVTFTGRRIPLGVEGSWTLRDDVLAEAIFPERPRLRRIVPRSLARLREVKWAGPGHLERPDGRSSPGWIIWETVSWP